VVDDGFQMIRTKDNSAEEFAENFERTEEHL